MGACSSPARRKGRGAGRDVVRPVILGSRGSGRRVERASVSATEPVVACPSLMSAGHVVRLAVCRVVAVLGGGDERVVCLGGAMDAAKTVERGRSADAMEVPVRIGSSVLLPSNNGNRRGASHS